MGFSKAAHAESFLEHNKNGHRRYEPLHPQSDDGINLLKMGLTSVVAGLTVSSSVAALRAHPLPAFLGFSLLFFMKLEYTIEMVMPGKEPRDLGFESTRWLHHLLASHPLVNSIFAACNTGFVVLQGAYVLWTFIVNRRKRPAIAALFMYAFRAFVGYSTQLPMPKDFLGSSLDFPVNNTSFFLFFSGHVAGSVIVSMDMRRMQCHCFGLVVDFLNVLQSLRLLATRGHYTIDLVVGAAAGLVCDLLAGKYEEIQEKAGNSCECRNTSSGSNF